MILENTLILLTWCAPLVLGLIQLVARRDLSAVTAWAALPGVLAALIVPAGTVVDVPALLLGTQFMVDATGRTFLLFTALLWLAAGVFAAQYLSQDPARPRFFVFFLLAMSGNMGLILAGDMLSFYFWFALMSFASYGLIIHTGQADAHSAGRTYMALVIIGEVILFAGLVLLATASGTLIVSELPGAPVDDLTVALIFISFGIKAGVVLLHLWLPLAHPAAPIPASAVLSGAMIKAGVIGWLRFLHPAESAPDWGALVIALGLVTAFYGALMGVSQINPKTVLAYSSISQMGFIMVGVGAWLLSPELGQAALIAVGLYALHHALAKGALFLGVAFAGAGWFVPVILLLPALSLAGLTLTSGAVAKTALKTVTDALPQTWIGPLSTPLSLGAVGTTLLMARFLWLIWRSPAPKKPIPQALWGVWLALIVAVAGVIYLLPDAATAASDSLKPDKIETAIVPIVAGAVIAVVAGVVGSRLPLKLPLVPPGDALGLIVQALIALGGLALAALYLLDSLKERLLAALGGIPVALNNASGTLTRAELRLRLDWVVAGSALLLLAVGILFTVWAEL